MLIDDNRTLARNTSITSALKTLTYKLPVNRTFQDDLLVSICSDKILRRTSSLLFLNTVYILSTSASCSRTGIISNNSTSFASSNHVCTGIWNKTFHCFHEMTLEVMTITITFLFITSSSKKSFPKSCSMCCDKMKNGSKKFQDLSIFTKFPVV